MSDVAGRLIETQREVGSRRIAAGEARTALMRWRYGAPIEDVWDACTDPDRISRWFVKPTGDLRPGGTFSLEGNASGEILRCEPPRLLTVTWSYPGRPVDEVEVRLSPSEDGGTVLELEHASVADVFITNAPETGTWGIGPNRSAPPTASRTRNLRSGCFVVSNLDDHLRPRVGPVRHVLFLLSLGCYLVQKPS
jgi:uncharacterized protein YndB with AHSA1/START domain